MSVGEEYCMGFIDIEVAGYVIWLPMAKNDYIYADKTFMSVEDAYDRGFLTKDDVYKVGCLLDWYFLERYPTPL